MSAEADTQRIHSSQWRALALLTLVYMLHTMDRNVISALVEPIKHEFKVSDRGMGALSGLAHSIAFAIAVLPVGWLADRVNRTRLLASLLATWSVMTALSGVATSYLGLLVARLGVGGAEAGTSPTCMSLISDLFPPNRRASAIGVFYLSTALGTGVVFLVGAAVAQHHGWRAMFFAAGAPGIVVACLLLLFLREPARGRFETDGSLIGAGMGDAIRHILRNRSVLALVMAVMLAAMLVSSLWTWTASFLIRIHGLEPKQAGLVIAIAAGVGMALGSSTAGPLADRLARGIPSRLAFVPSATTALSVLAAFGMLFAPTAPTAIGFALLMGVMLGGWFGPGYGLLLTLTPVSMRGRVTATSQLLSNLVGAGLGPLLTGALSDHIGGPDSLRLAIALTMIVGVLAAVLFALAGWYAIGDMTRIDASGQMPAAAARA